MIKGSGTHRAAVKRANRVVKKTVHKRLKPFLKAGALRICEGRKVGALDGNYIAAEYTHGHNLLKNGDFEIDEDHRGHPDHWKVHMLGGTAPTTRLSANADQGAYAVNVTDHTIFNPDDPMIFEAVHYLIDSNTPDGVTAINQGVVAKWRHKRREYAWMGDPWAGGNTIPLSASLLYPHEAGTHVQKAMVCIDDRDNAAYHGHKCVRLDVPNANSVTRLISDSFSVKPGEIYYCTIFARRAFNAGQPTPSASTGFNWFIDWQDENYNIFERQELISKYTVLETDQWGVYEAIVQAPRFDALGSQAEFGDPGVSASSAKHAHIVLENHKQFGSPIWVDYAFVLDSGQHNWHYGYYNPGAKMIHNPVWVPKKGATYTVPVGQYPENTGNVNVSVYCEDGLRDLATRFRMSAQMHVADASTSTAICYAAEGVQPNDFYMLQLNGSHTGDSIGGQGTAQLWHCRNNADTGNFWQYTLIGSTSNINLQGSRELYYHGVRLIHDPTITEFGGPYGAVIGSAFGASFAGASCAFAQGLPGLFGCDSLGERQINHIPIAGFVKNITVDYDYVALDGVIAIENLHDIQPPNYYPPADRSGKTWLQCLPHIGASDFYFDDDMYFGGVHDSTSAPITTHYRGRISLPQHGAAAITIGSSARCLATGNQEFLAICIASTDTVMPTGETLPSHHAAAYMVEQPVSTDFHSGWTRLSDICDFSGPISHAGGKALHFDIGINPTDPTSYNNQHRGYVTMRSRHAFIETAANATLPHHFSYWHHDPKKAIIDTVHTAGQAPFDGGVALGAGIVSDGAHYSKLFVRRLHAWEGKLNEHRGLYHNTAHHWKLHFDFRRTAQGPYLQWRAMNKRQSPASLVLDNGADWWDIADQWGYDNSLHRFKGLPPKHTLPAGFGDMVEKGWLVFNTAVDAGQAPYADPTFTYNGTTITVYDTAGNPFVCPPGEFSWIPDNINWHSIENNVAHLWKLGQIVTTYNPRTKRPSLHWIHFHHIHIPGWAHVRGNKHPQHSPSASKRRKTNPSNYYWYAHAHG